MIRRRHFCLTLVAACAASLSGQEGKPVVEGDERASAINSPFTKAVGKVLETIETIKPGMTRTDLLKIFEEEGGLSWRGHQTYVYRLCPYIKVDFDFQPAAEPDAYRAEDKIIKMSRPYLAYSVAD